MVVFIDELKESLTYLKKNWSFIPIVAFIDMLFFLLLGVGNFFFKQHAGPSISQMFESISRLGTQMTVAVSEGQSALSVLFNDPNFSLSFNSLFKILALVAVGAYLLWIVFNGASWALANKMLEKKLNLRFFSKFSAVSVVWFFIFSVIFASFMRFILFALFRNPPLLSSDTIQTLATVINWIFFYFMFISISLVDSNTVKENIKKTFIYGVKGIFDFIPAYAVIILVLYINFWITFLIFSPLLQSLDSIALIATMIRFIIAAPFLTFARMYLILTSRRVAKSN